MRKHLAKKYTYGFKSIRKAIKGLISLAPEPIKFSVIKPSIMVRININTAKAKVR